LIGEPFHGCDDVVVEDAILAFAECEPGEICKPAVRNNDGAPQPDRTERLIQFLLGQRHVNRGRFHFKGIVEDLALFGVLHQEEDLLLAFLEQCSSRLAAHPRQNQIADEFDP